MPSLGRTPSICRDGEEIRLGLDEFLRGAEPTKAGERWVLRYPLPRHLQRLVVKSLAGARMLAHKGRP